MSTEAWNKIIQSNDHRSTKRAPGNQLWLYDGGFNDGRYYQIIEVLLRANLDLPLILSISKEEL